MKSPAYRKSYIYAAITIALKKYHSVEYTLFLSLAIMGLKIAYIFIHKGPVVQDSIFRQYDIRGKVGTELILDQVYSLGRAIAYYFLQVSCDEVKTIAIGRDGREHSEYIEQELVRAFTDSGLDVMSIGVCPTPALYFSLYTLPVEAGLMITASHNGKEYNGVKLCLAKEPIWGEQLEEIKKLFYEKKRHKSVLAGSVRSYPMAQRYMFWLADKFKHLKHFDQHVVFDLAHAAAATVVPELVEKIGMRQVSFVCQTLDASFPSHEPDPVVEQNTQDLKRALISRNAQLGIGFDGDADRMAPITQQGILVPGDKLIALFAQDILEHNPGASIIFDVKCSALLPQLLANWGAQYKRVPCGHSIIKHNMKQTQALFGGELSCHFFFKDRYFGYDDGIYTALRLCELLQTKSKSLDELVNLLPSSFNTPEIRIMCAPQVQQRLLQVTQQFFAARQDADISSIDGVQATLPYGWGLLRSSNTQPVLSLRFEAPTQEGLVQIKQDFYAVLKDYIDPEVLQKSLTL